MMSRSKAQEKSVKKRHPHPLDGHVLHVMADQGLRHERSEGETAPAKKQCDELALWGFAVTRLIQRLGKWVARVFHRRSGALHWLVFEHNPPIALNAATGIKGVQHLVLRSGQSCDANYCLLGYR